MILRIATAKDLIEYLASGLITKAEWDAHLGAYVAPPAALDKLTIEQYGDIVTATDDIAALAIYRRFLRRPALTAGCPAAAVCREIAALKAGVERISRAFEAIPHVGLTAEERQAGFGQKNFGLFGLVDRLARRQSITDAEARAITVGDAIGKLTIDATEAVANKRYREIMSRKRTRK